MTIKIKNAKKPKIVNLKDIQRFELDGKMYCCEDELNYYWNSVFEDAAREAIGSVEAVLKKTLKEIKESRGIK